MKRLLCVVLLVSLVGCSRRDAQPATPPESSSTAQQETYSLFVMIPDPITPAERTQKYTIPLHHFLVAESLGLVTGGGTLLSDTNESGLRSIESIGLDVEVYDPDKALPIMIEKLKELGVPEGTKIEQSEPVERTIKAK